MSKMLRIAAMLTMLVGLSWQVEAAELSLICPCQAERVGQTAVKITAGVINTGDTESGELRVSLGGSSSLPIVQLSYRAFRYFPEALKSGWEYSAGTEATVAFQLPRKTYLDSLGRTHLTLGLQEKVDGEWLDRQVVRLGSPVTFPDPEVGGESANFKLFLEGKPSLEIEGSEATLRIPKVVNSSLEAVTISRVVIGHYPSAEFWGKSYYLGLKEDDLSITVEPLSSLTNIEIKGDYSGPRESEPFRHLFLQSENGVEVWETIEAREGNVISTYPFTANSIDFLVDSDDDGVSDFNEDLFNTDPTDATSQPETVVIDVMALYTPAVATAYNNEPEAKILHELEWGNQALRNSNINARFRLVKAQSTNYEGLDLDIALDAVTAQTGVFEGIDAVREEVGADLLVLYVENDPDGELCGLATASGVWASGAGSDGDLGFNTRSQSAAVIPAGCRTNSLTHEFGHNMGLGHDAREETAPVGTFDWSRGHGVDGLFSTIMAYEDGYDYFGPDIQYFSNPEIPCNGQPCGVDKSDLSLGADAALSIRTTMHQVSQLTAGVVDSDNDNSVDEFDNCPNDVNRDQLDTDQDGLGDVCDTDDDGDGVPDTSDAFPLDPSETKDTDGDGIGDNADTDDDGDGLSDALEISIGYDPLNANDATGSSREILWRHAEKGWNTLWSMEANNLVEKNALNTVPDTDWTVAGMADFTGDGLDEIFFRHQTFGWNRLWLIEDGQRTASLVVQSAAKEWQLAVMGDFDGDGDADLIWRNENTGANRYWEMDRETRLRSVAVRGAPLSWRIEASGDFDGDGIQDLFWRNNNGANTIWLMDEEQIKERGAINTVGSFWTIAGTGDVDQDGMEDVFWHNPDSGANSVWLINGTERKGRGTLPSVSSEWRPMAVEEMDGDGMADLLWRNINGQHRLWRMNGTSRSSSTPVNTITDLNWQPAAVGNVSN